MIDPTAIFRTGIAVPDLEAAQRFYAESLGVEWAPVHHYKPLSLWLPGQGRIEVELRAVYSRAGPNRLELIEGTKGSFYDPATMATPLHTGLFVDNVGDEVVRLSALGWRLMGSKGSPERHYGNMAYMGHPTENLVFELVGRELEPMLEAWYVEPFPDEPGA